MRLQLLTVCIVALALSSSIIAQNRVPTLVDPGFESFKLAQAPLFGWYSDDVMYQADSRFAGVTMTPDSEIRIEGHYSLRIEQLRPRGINRGQAFLAQALRLPKSGGVRDFDLGVQMRGGLRGPVTLEVYVWERSNTVRITAHRDVRVTKEWTNTSLSFKVPSGYDQFGVWVYLPPTINTVG